MQTLARDRGGRCLSENYTNNYSKLLWQCKEGHRWDAPPTNIKSGKWCPFCAGNHRATIEEMQRIAEGKGGRCLSKEYTNNSSKLLWQCKEGHEWDAVPASIKRGKWCPTCGGAQKGTLEEMQRIAEGKGGLCLSAKYINNYSKLRWQCKAGHRWKAVPSSVKRGYWCSRCSRKNK